MKLEKISFLHHSFNRQTNVIYSGESKWTNLGQQLFWNHFAYQYSFGLCEQVKLSRGHKILFW